MPDHIPLYGAVTTRFLDAAFAKVISKLDELYDETGQETIRIANGFFLVLDQKNGGDSTSEELIRRFHTLDESSTNIMDFYYLGWIDYSESFYDPLQQLEFSLHDFQACLRTLKKEYGVFTIRWICRLDLSRWREGWQRQVSEIFPAL